jgi:hypothetical protein
MLNKHLQSVTKIDSVTNANLVTPKAGAKYEILINKLTSSIQVRLKQHIKVRPNSSQRLI